MHFPGELKSPSPKLCQQLHLLLKKRRVSAQLDALERLIEFYVTNMENESLSAFAAKVSHLVSLYGSRNMILSLDMVEKLIENILKDSNPQTTHSIRVIDTFRDIPIPSLGSDSNTIYLKESPGLKVFDTPENMLEKYKIRYKFLLSRALECKKAACLEQGDPLAQFYKEVSSIFTPIQNLNNADHFHTSLFGMLGKLEGDQYFIEDETGYVALDLTETSFQDRIYTPGCITMADGEWNGQVFRVTQMQMPPLNASLLNRMELKTLFQGNDYPMNISESQQNQIIIMLSDIWLDHESVLNKLEKLFRSFHSENICPNAIVFMGNFLSPDEDQLLHLKNGFQHLASLLQKYISNEKCQLIFVPGPNDPVCNY